LTSYDAFLAVYSKLFSLFCPMSAGGCSCARGWFAREI
jgi:hypothetical protein